MFNILVTTEITRIQFSNFDFIFTQENITGFIVVISVFFSSRLILPFRFFDYKLTNWLLFVIFVLLYVLFGFFKTEFAFRLIFASLERKKNIWYFVRLIINVRLL